MSYELQCIDCNCNDCGFMVRNLEKYKESLALNESLQRDQFDRSVQKIRDVANKAKDMYYDLEKWDYLHSEADKMKFQFNKKSVTIQYGHCTKLDKDVSFIPGQCQLGTQVCFVHRKDIIKPNKDISHDR